MNKVVPFEWSEKDKIESIVRDIEKKTGHKVKYEHYWWWPVTDKNKHWKLEVEGYINTINIPNAFLMLCGVKEVNKIADYFIKEIKHWDNLMDKTVIEVKAELIEDIPERSFYENVREYEGLL